MYDTVIIGCGIAGSVAARQLAERGGHKVLVVEQRDHIGGNCYDKKDSHGILIHEYGPHIFHTNMEHVYKFLSRFTEWNFFGHKVVADIQGKLIPVPFNLNTLHMVYEEDEANILEKKLVEEYGMNSRVPIMRLRENEDEKIRQIADYVYENIFLHYTMKQWGQTPEEISPDVTGRVPVLISKDDRYFQDKYQGMPKKSYTAMFERMLEHENIKVLLNTDCKSILVFKEKEILLKAGADRETFTGNLIFTGALDELFNCCEGRLPYRALDFEFEHYDMEDYQGHSVVNYTISEDFTRITEFKHLTGQRCSHTTIVKEYPFAYSGREGEIPYYAISNHVNEALHQKYVQKTASYKNMYLLGRLAEYKYYNIDVMTDKALQLSEQILNMEKKG